MTTDRVQLIRERLTAAFEPEILDVRDNSHRHAGHPGAREGKGHFAVTIVSRRFQGKSILECHRMVYEALGDLMLTDIHALQVIARSAP